MKNARPEGEGCRSAFEPATKKPNGRYRRSRGPEIVVHRRAGRKVFLGFVEKDRRSRGGGKSGNTAAVAGFPSAEEKSCLWTFPRSGFFHGPCTPTDCARKSNKEKAMTKKHSNPMPELAIPKLSEGQLETLFRRLNLAHTRRIYQQVADRP